jgi:hypothetical protein
MVLPVRRPKLSYVKEAVRLGPEIVASWFLAFQVYVVVPLASVKVARLPLRS